MNEIEDDLDSIIESLKNFSPEKRQLKYKIKSEKYTIQEIINFVDKNEWALLDLQRDFIWKDDKIKDLLDSLLRDYFIGTLLIVDVNSKNNSFGVRNVSNTNANIDNIKGLILDGQQRITSLYRAIKPDKFNDIKGYFYIDIKALMKYYASNDKDVNFDIIRKEKQMLPDKETYEKMYFPFYKMENYLEWIVALSDYVKENKIIKEGNNSTFNSIVSRTIPEFLTKTIPTVELPSDIDLNSLSEIFERINTKGTELTNFDLTVARLSRYGIKLKDELLKERRNEIKEYAEKIFNETFIKTKLPLLIIQGISLYRTNRADRDTLLNLYNTEYLNKTPNPKEEFENDWNTFVNKLKVAINRMYYSYYARPGLVPFPSVLPVLIALLKLKEESSGKKEELDKKIDNWYWSAVLTGAYSKSSESQMATDISQVKSWFENGDIPKTVSKAINDWNANTAMSHLKNDITYNDKDSIFKSIICLIALKGTPDFATGNAFGGKPKSDIDHIFPRSEFVKSEYKGHEYVDSIINLTLLDPNTNRVIKKDKLPSKYIEDFISDRMKKENIPKNNAEDKFRKDLEFHFINEEAYEAMKDDNFETFLEARGKVILEEIRKRIMPQSLTQPRNTAQHDNTRPNKHNTSQHNQKVSSTTK